MRAEGSYIQEAVTCSGQCQARAKAITQLKNAKKNLKDETGKAYRSDYFYIHNETMKRQLNKSVMEEEVEPVVEHQLEK